MYPDLNESDYLDPSRYYSKVDTCIQSSVETAITEKVSITAVELYIEVACFQKVLLRQSLFKRVLMPESQIQVSFPINGRARRPNQRYFGSTCSTWERLQTHIFKTRRFNNLRYILHGL